MNFVFQKIVVIVFALLLSCASVVYAAPSDLQLVKATVQAFFDYLLKPNTRIEEDFGAQNKWLSKDLKRLMAEATLAVTKAQKQGLIDGPDPHAPDNNTFLDAWDKPTSCHAVSALEPADKDYIDVKIICNWGNETNYPGTMREATARMVKESGAWHVFNINWQKNEYADVSNLIQILQELKAEVDALAK